MPSEDPESASRAPHHPSCPAEVEGLENTGLLGVNGLKGVLEKNNASLGKRALQRNLLIFVKLKQRVFQRRFLLHLIELQKMMKTVTIGMWMIWKGEWLRSHARGPERNDCPWRGMF